MADFGSGGPVMPPGLEDLSKQPHDLLVQRQKHDGHRPPKRPRGPRFRLLRRIVRLIRGGGD